MGAALQAMVVDRISCLLVYRFNANLLQNIVPASKYNESSAVLGGTCCRGHSDLVSSNDREFACWLDGNHKR